MNPITLAVEGQRRALLQGMAPFEDQLITLAFIAAITFVIGLFVFGRLKKGFYNYL